MSFEALKKVLSAEAKARQDKERTVKEAEIVKNKAIRSGKDIITKTLSRAETEAVHLIRATDQKATDEARILASKTANRQAMQRARAERLLDKASDFICERIVNG